MKKYIQLTVVLALILVVIAMAGRGAVWTSALSKSLEPAQNAPSIELSESASYAPQVSSIVITESGTYTLGGLCTVEVVYNLPSGLQDQVDVNVPVDFSSSLPFGYEGDLYLPGCHIQHIKEGDVVKQTDGADGSWEICFEERPDVELSIYYYPDKEFTDSQYWIELEAIHGDGFVCANSIYTGEYTVGSKVDAELEPYGDFIPGTGEKPPAGTVLPPSPRIPITSSGTYAIGGICTLEVIYREPNQSDEIHVADALRHDMDPVDDYRYSEFVEFPEGEGMLYLPGCHVVHYQTDGITRWEKTVAQGEWEICFAARPDRDVTIYYYIGDYTDQESPWLPLETTVDNGMACAPAFYTGVYVPTGK